MSSGTIICRRGHNPGSRECSRSHRDDVLVKSAILKVSHSVVSILTYGLPDDMLHYCAGKKMVFLPSSTNQPVFWGSGVIIESHDRGDGTYFATILTAASIFKRTGDIKPNQIKVDVYLSGGKRIGAEVICCDFHYNLAAIRVQADCPLPIPTLRALDDILPLDLNALFRLQQQAFQLRPHSDSMKILPGELVIALGRFYLNGRYNLEISPGFFSEKQFGPDCGGVYAVDCCSQISDDGGPVINRLGEVIGIRFHNKGQQYTPFLPTNVILRWWSHQKKYGEFRRPCLGMEICNLRAVGFDVLERFPSIATGVIVTKVQEDSPAKHAKICCHDVIVQCDGNEVRSILEFFERIWEKTGESVELKILRACKSGVLERKQTLTIGETTPDNFHSWRLPAWTRKKPVWALKEEADAGMVIYDD